MKLADDWIKAQIKFTAYPTTKNFANNNQKPSTKRWQLCIQQKCTLHISDY